MPPESEPPTAPRRTYYIDWLPVAAVLLLFPFHTGRVFNAGEARVGLLRFLFGMHPLQSAQPLVHVERVGLEPDTPAAGTASPAT